MLLCGCIRCSYILLVFLCSGLHFIVLIFSLLLFSHVFFGLFFLLQLLQSSLSQEEINLQFAVFSLCFLSVFSPTIIYFLCSSSLLESPSLILERRTTGKAVLICSISASSWHNCSSPCLTGFYCYLTVCLMLTWGLVSHWSSWTNY